MPWRTLLIVAAGLCGLIFAVAREAWIDDDALITFRYVDHLVDGDGLVFNRGERVEGLSNPLFALLLAPLVALGGDPWTAAIVLGALFGAIELGLLAWAVALVTERLAAIALAVAAFATDRIVAVWTTGGLETSLHGALTMAVLVLAMAPPSRRRAALAAAALLLAAVSRPEGIVLTPIYLGWLALRGGAGARDELIRVINVVALGLAVAIAVRYLYYGDLVANTYRAKVDGVPRDDLGWVYAQQFARRMGWWHPLHIMPWIGLIVAALVAWRRPVDRGAGALAARALVAASVAGVTVAIAIAAAIWVGGDYHPDFRFLRPAMAAIYLGAAALFAAALSGDLRVRVVAFVAVAGLAASHVARQREAVPIAPDAPPSARHKLGVAADRGRSERFRAAIGRIAEPGDRLLVDRAGVYAWGHDLYAIDATGLVSRHLDRDFVLRDAFDEQGRRERFPGHARWPRVEYMQRVRFTFIFPVLNRAPPTVAGIQPSSPRRRREYPFVEVVMPAGPGEYLRFLTTMTAAEVEARARARALSLCWREPFGPLRCSDEVAP